MLQRKKLRRNLRCKTFDWYMKTILPDMPVPSTDARHFGKIFKANDGDKCFRFEEDVLKVLQCDLGTWKSVTFIIDVKGRFKFEEQCIYMIRDDAKNKYKLDTKSNCAEAGSSWTYDSNTLHLSLNGLCLEEDETSHEIKVETCEDENKNQKWNFEIEFNFSRKHDVLKTSIDHQMIPRNTIKFGAMINIKENYCLNIGDKQEYEMIPCDEQPSYFQIIHLDNDKRLVYEDKCVIMFGQGHIGIEKCEDEKDSQHIWQYDGNSMHFYTLNVSGTKLCWTFNVNSTSIQLMFCDTSNIQQRWKFHSSSH